MCLREQAKHLLWEPKIVDRVLENCPGWQSKIPSFCTRIVESGITKSASVCRRSVESVTEKSQSVSSGSVQRGNQKRRQCAGEIWRVASKIASVHSRSIQGGTK
jgi:hypothetical protein